MKSNVSSKWFFEFFSKKSKQDGFSGFSKEAGILDKRFRLYT